MKDDNLTRAEAEARAARLSVLSYDVALDLAGDGDTFASTTTVRFQCTEPGSDTFVDLDAAAVRELTLNGAAGRRSTPSTASTAASTSGAWPPTTC